MMMTTEDYDRRFLLRRRQEEEEEEHHDDGCGFNDDDVVASTTTTSSTTRKRRKRRSRILVLSSWKKYLATLSCLVAAALSSSSTSYAQQQQAASADAAAGADTSNWSAGKLRSRSDEAMMAGDYSLAVKLLNQAIDVEPGSASNLYRLYKVHHRQRKWMDALDAITRAVEKQQQQGGESGDKKKEEDYRSYKAKLLVQLGQCDRAVKEYEQQDGIAAADDNDSEYQKAKKCDNTIRAAQDLYYENDFLAAAKMFERALSYIEIFASDLVWLKAKSLYETGDYYGAISDTGKLLKQHSQHIDAYNLRGDAYRKLGEHEQAVLHYREGLKLDPEHAACKAGHKLVKSIEKKKKKGDDAYAKGEYQTAIDNWTAAMEIDPSHVMFNRPMSLQIARAHSKAGQHDRAIEIAKNHLEEEETLEGLWALGEMQTGAEMFEEAVRTYQQAYEKVEDSEGERKKEAQKKLQEAKVALKQSKEKNYYKILGVARTATSKEIKKAYREKALRWHPDKVSDDEKEKAQTMFQDIGEAYEVLSDDELKAKYDRGEEVFENQGGGQRHHHDPFQFFNAQFQQGGQRRHHRTGGGNFHVRFN